MSMYFSNVLLLPDNDSQRNQLPAMSAQKKNAISRLMRDLKEWHDTKDEFPCINACPLESNIFEWHCNVCPDSGDFKDVIFHLIIIFDETYPVRAPDVKLCTPIPHPNVFDDWICLDMLKRYEIGEKYQGWTAAYSVTSLLMQLQSFLFEQKTVAQMGYSNYSVKRRFDKSEFKSHYLPRIEAFECNGCKHCYKKPFPMTPSIDNLNDCESKTIEHGAKSGDTKATTGESKMADKQSQERNWKRKDKKDEINYWKIYVYKDLADTIFSFFNIDDLMKVRRVNKEFQLLAKNTKILQKDSIRCWFHRCTMMKNKNDSELLCLGFGIKPNYFRNSYSNLKDQLFASPKLAKELTSQMKLEIGRLPMIESIDITFDLLSSNAFSQFGIRKSVFNDLKFTHFLPLYINKKHGKMAMDEMDEYVYKIFLPNSRYINGVTTKLHPWVKLITVGQAMKSLIVSVMNDSETHANRNNGKISLHYSINVLEAFFKLHHTLLGVYFHHKNELSKLLQHQIALFFQCDENGNYRYRNKRAIPDLGVFFAYLTLWTNENGYLWNDIATELLDETFIRQVKWVCNANYNMAFEDGCSLKERESTHWQACRVSNKLFLFFYFFYKECCQIGEKTPFDKFEEYNNNFGNLNDDTMAVKFQKFVKKVSSSNVNGYKEFFNIIGVKYPGSYELGNWFIDCLHTSEYRGYHKQYIYENTQSKYEYY